MNAPPTEMLSGPKQRRWKLFHQGNFRGDSGEPVNTARLSPLHQRKMWRVEPERGASAVFQGSSAG